MDRTIAETFEIDSGSVCSILCDYGIQGSVAAIIPLLRYHFSGNEGRLILKVTFEDHAPVVIKIRNEKDLTRDIVEQQSIFSAILMENGVPTARPFQARGRYTSLFSAGGYDALVTVEEFCEQEILSVDVEAARKTGQLLAKTHNISEAHDCHVNFPVLFDPFTSNDLFFVEEFKAMGAELSGADLACYHRIMEKYDQHMNCLSPLRAQARYAVQGDISNNNLFLTSNGEIGLFDLNRCGDNNLFCDAVMQAVFEARLMDYAPGEPPSEESLLKSFLSGYHEIRPFTAEQVNMIPHLYAVISAFWGMDLIYGEHGALKQLLKNRDTAAVSQTLTSMENKVNSHLNVGYLM